MGDPVKASNYTSVCKYATRGLATTIIYFYYGSQRGEKAKKGKKEEEKQGKACTGLAYNKEKKAS